MVTTFKIQSNQVILIGPDLNHWHHPCCFIVLFCTIKEFNLIYADHEKYIFIPDSWLFSSDAGRV